MASTVKRELDKANPNNVADLERLAKLGSALAVISRTEIVSVSSHIGVLSQPARQILRCYSTTGTLTGELTPVDPEATPATTECAVNALGNVAFAAADAVTEAEVTYVPIEENLVEETIPVTAGGLGTFNGQRRCLQLVSATLNSPAATPGAKTVEARGTTSPSAGACAVQDDSTTIQFVAGEAGSICTATVSYHVFPGVGYGDVNGLGDRLDVDFTP